MTLKDEPFEEPQVTLAAARAQLDRGVTQYIRAIHLSRVIIAAATILVAVSTLDEIPTAYDFAVAVPVIGLAWIVLITLQWKRIERQIERHPWIIWLDPIVLIGLMMLNKPWDSLIVLPYCSFVLLVPYVRPRSMVILVIITAIATYVPKIVLTALDWRYAELVPPVTDADWMTSYVGPLFCGTVAWALCALHAGIRSSLDAREQAEHALMDTRAQASRLIARQHLANRLHETLSQVVRAIPLRLDGAAPAGADEAARAIRSQIVDLALEIRPAVQNVARGLREPALETPGPSSHPLHNSEDRRRTPENTPNGPPSSDYEHR